MPEKGPVFVRKKVRQVELSERKRKILKAIIDGYIETAEPVGSSTIAKYCLKDCSSATIRNEMAYLEEMGYLEKTHTSSGRIPSYLGYRIYVDMLMEKYRLTVSEMNDLAHRMETKAAELSKIAKRAGRTLSSITNYPSFVITPATNSLKLKSVRLIVVSDSLVLIVLVASGDMIKDRKIKAPRDLDQGTADRLSGIMTGLLAHKTFEEMDFNASVFREISRFWPEFTPEFSGFAKEALTGGDGEVFCEGAANILRYREYRDADKAKALLDFVGDDENLKKVASETENDDSCVTVIGEETGLSALSDCSLVVKSYSASPYMKGAIGIIGPSRMDYSKVMSTLEYMAEAMDNILRQIK